MAKKMLIDAAHPEETRVVVVSGNRIEEFDFEAAAKKPLKGNIYLAKVTRVEPSLQAAFVDYGGNRHGFLAFNEIHPDYYQIPVADRQRLIAQQEEAAARRAREEEPVAVEPALETASPEDDAAPADGDAVDAATSEREDGSVAEERDAAASENGNEDDPDSSESEADIEDVTETLSAAAADPAPPVHAGGAGDDIDDAFEEARGRRFETYGRPYKIHEVIKRRQILLVQVVKEERGTKGAALTTYLSLAGRYCVLMPNTARGGGISRKITNQVDRKRLKAAVNELDIPPGLGLIIRTAGANRTKAEIKRDYEYLLRVWENVRDLTLKSTAPALVYEEGNLIKRAIRDLYSKEIEAILVDGDDGYRDAKNFMRTLMPSHAKVVQPYKDRIPLFQRYQIESLLDQMFNPVVHLRSGGYIVINQTEALVAIDVNSGRATREHSIEETALRTNLEAAEEVARQLRLRDLAGLIVIDFIDMEEGRNNRAVEKRLKESLKSDRARIQVGRISSFGLMEMSRQRLRAGVLEGSTNRCPHCEGTGIIRSVESAALRTLRAMEEEGLRDRTAVMTVRVPANVALYILNYKRADISEIEQRYGCICILNADDTMAASGFALERTETKEPGQARPDATTAVRLETAYEAEPEALEGEAEPEEEELEGAEADDEGARPSQSVNGDGSGRRKRRRRRRRGRRGDEPRAGDESAPQISSDAGEDMDAPEEMDEPVGEEAGPAMARPGSAERDSRRRRRGRRGGRRNRGRGDDVEIASSTEERSSAPLKPVNEVEALERISEPTSTWQPPSTVSEAVTPESSPYADSDTRLAEREPAVVAGPAPEPAYESATEPEPEPEPEAPAGPPRRGWWQRRFGG